MTKKKFQDKVWDFYRKNKRDFPWRNTTNPYFILVSEVMLQQTQTARVIEKYNQFISELPTIKDLANIEVAKLLSLWQGLGYNRRALYLKRSAEEVVKNSNGIISKKPDELIKLPGIGPNTAASIIVFSYNAPLVFIETNIRRTFIYNFFSKETLISDKEILLLIEQTLDKENPREWYYALMDYGAYLGKSVTNPNRKSKHYTKQSKFQGSLRQVRGAILKQLLLTNKISEQELKQKIEYRQDYYSKALNQLEKEGFIEIHNNLISFSDSRH